MPFDAESAADLLAAEVAACPAPGPEGWPFGAPPRDLARSPVAARVGRLAARAGLGLYHWEHRHHLPLPEDWVPEHAPDLADPPAWGGGVLPERKYQSFRHDQAIGSFHPGMRAKWTAHELCHALVGFAWRPGAPPLFHATAGRLAELLPVALWYFLDEAHLRRCRLHRETGPLFRRSCEDCEAAAEARVDDLLASSHLDAGRLFVERELRAIYRSRSLGLAVPHVHGSLDLTSDGIAYAAAHLPRLSSEAFERFASGFLVEGGGFVRTLDDLEARVLAVLDALVSDAPLAPLAPAPEHGRVRWVVQDLGWRLLELWHQTEGEAADALLAIVDALAQVTPTTADPTVPAAAALARGRTAVADARRAYVALAEEYELPEPADLFALGHDALGVARGSDLASLREGITGALPATTRLLGDEIEALVDAFAAEDAPVRAPIGRRFATWLLGRAAPALGDLARFEAELAHAAPPDPSEALLGDPVDGRWRLASGVALLRTGVDVVAMASEADFGDLVPAPGLDVRDVDGAPIAARPGAVAVRLGPDGTPAVHPLTPEVAGALLRLGEGAPLALPAPTVRALADAGLIRAARWAVE